MFNFLLGAAEQAAPAAQAAGQAAQAGQQTQTNPMGMLILMTGAFILMFFLMSRSNKKQQQKRDQMISQIAKGTKVILASGFLGTIVEVREKTFLVEIANGVRVEVVQAGIGDIVPAEEPAKK